MSILNQTVDRMQTLDFSIIAVGDDLNDLAFETGKSDAMQGQPYSAEFYFAGNFAAMDNYGDGFIVGLQQSAWLCGADELAMDEALEAIRQQPPADSAWYAQVEDEQIGHEYSIAPYLY